MSILQALGHSILLETFSDERLINHRGYIDAGIPLMRYTKTVGESLPNFSTGLFFVPVGDVSPVRSSPSIPSTGRILIYY